VHEYVTNLCVLSNSYRVVRSGLGYAGNVSPQGLASLPLASYL